MTDAPNHEPSHWPPGYTLRLSTRARRPFLQITAQAQLEIVVPEKQKRLNIDSILTMKRVWIEKMLWKMRERSEQKQDFPLERPQIIDCAALATIWNIVYDTIPRTQRIRIVRSDTDLTLCLRGNTDNHPLCRQMLLRWVIQEARRVLPLWLQQLSHKTGLSYHQVIIRGQNTLWGSCNARKNISLNYKLLFLPTLLAEHVLLHELCHTKYLNHSKRFWLLLQQCDPHCEEHKKALKTADRYLPAWLTRV